MSSDLTGPFPGPDAVALSIGIVCLLAAAVDEFVVGIGPIDAVPIVTIGSFGFLLGTSTLVVSFGLHRFTGDELGRDDDIEADTGWLIGKLENVLVLSFVLQDAYTGLSVIFAAKSFIRRDDTSSENTTYYLAGTLLNFTYSLVVGLALPL